MTFRRKKIVYIIKKLNNPAKGNGLSFNYSLPLIAELWEETIHRDSIDLNYKTTWTPDENCR